MAGDAAERSNLVEEKSRQAVVKEMRKRLADWFARYVDPARDGLRCPVTGLGQAERIDADHCGEGAFAPPA